MELKLFKKYADVPPYDHFIDVKIEDKMANGAINKEMNKAAKPYLQHSNLLGVFMGYDADDFLMARFKIRLFFKLKTETND